MERKPIKSKVLNEVGYELAERKLEVKFHTGKTIQYFNVSPLLYNMLVSTKSPELFFSNYIEETYRCVELDIKDSGIL